MISLDLDIVLWIQRLAGLNIFIDAFGIFCASVLIWFQLAFVVVFWTFGRHRTLELFSVLASGALGWLASSGIGLLYFRPRPFAVSEQVQFLIDKSPLVKSFPSDHATIAFALAVSVCLVNRRWGYPLLVVAALVSLARIFVGVHYLSDVVAGAVIGSVCAFIVHRLIHEWLHTRHHQT